MLPRLVQGLFAACLCSAAFGVRTAIAADDPAGSVEGMVMYQPDSERPWRYARYYVGDSGALAEAVVCLTSKSLAGLQPPDEPAEVVMDQKNYRFVPETLAIRAGDQVRFTNGDPAAHNVFTGDGSDPFNVTMAVEGAHVQTFRRASGIRKPIRIGCTFHSTMQAWIFVFDHPFYIVTAEEGRFRFEGVPAGDYKLEVVHPAGHLSWNAPVTIKDGDTLVRDVTLSPDDFDKDKP